MGWLKPALKCPECGQDDVFLKIKITRTFHDKRGRTRADVEGMSYEWFWACGDPDCGVFVRYGGAKE